MDATEYEAIRGYLQTNIIPPEIKSDRYRKKNYVRKCKEIYFLENKLMKFFPVLCPLGCVCLEGERNEKVMKLEKRRIPEHQRDSCPLRELVCEFCVNKVKACEMNLHSEDCEHFPFLIRMDEYQKEKMGPDK
ncbi:hypothetical protein LOD99_10999 [Oopsacas minuta]|uniref:TAZ-type domain-containing protein n=1 Tax=Oopsacas minuta TaxID=111878 RepID=A0AAV7KBQ4_9METZ|nr:hypothetical protein LOD99_10999 [Oopsacas minuta]